MTGSGKRLIIRGIPVWGEEAVDITVDDGRIVSGRPAGSGPADIGDASSYLAQPLFDIQVNGAAGINLQGQDVRPEDVAALSERLAAWGVGHWVPTLITASFEDLAHGCRVMAEALQDPAVKRAVPGIHLEGPYISPVDGPRGAHPKQHVRPPDIREFDEWMKAADGNILYITVAPEAEGVCDFIRAVVDRGVVVSLGHHNAPPDAIEAAVDAGARLCTHLGNGLASQIHRHNNPLWPQLADDRLTASLIADLEHLPAEVLKTFVRAKGPAKVVLTSDAVHIAGMPPGHYSLGGHPVELLPSGRVCLSGTDLLAGSALMLLQGVVNAVWATDLTLEQAIASATTVPAKLLGLEAALTPSELGRRANLVVFDIDRAAHPWKARVRGVLIDGERKA